MDYEPTFNLFANPQYQFKMFPIPSDYRLQGYPLPEGAFDKHMLLIDYSNCTLYEIFLYRTGVGADLQMHTFSDASIAVDLGANDRKIGALSFKSSEAINVPKLPGRVCPIELSPSCSHVSPHSDLLFC